MKLVSLGSVVSIALMSTVVACSSTSEQVGSSEHAAVADVDHMIRRGDGSFDVYCADGSIERGVSPAQITANAVCATAAPSTGGSCAASLVPPAAAWKPPAPARNVCTPADIALMQQTASQPGATFPIIEAALDNQNSNCAQCVFTTESDAVWGPFVYQGGGGDAIVNWGACFARAPGGSDACGNAFHQTHSCALDMCAQCTTDQDFGTCYGAVSSDATACGAYDANTACGGDFAMINQGCMSPWDIITVVCGGATP